MHKKYNKFIFLSTLTRNLIEVFSCLLLYIEGYSIKNILLFLIIMQISGIITIYISLKTNFKITLIISSILYGLSFYYLSIMNKTIINLIIFACLLSISNYSYNIIKHLLAIKEKNNTKKEISITLISQYIAKIISTIIGAIIFNKMELKLASIIIIIISILSIIPIRKFKTHKANINIKKVIIPRKKIIFSILEQFKIIFITLQPLYLYIYIKKSIYYISTFNIIITLTSIILMYIITKKIQNKYFKYINIIFISALILKLNIKNNIILLLVALLEGIGQKIYEVMSLDNLYVENKNPESYLMKEELIFGISRTIILILYLVILKNNLIAMLYISIIGIYISAYFID